MAAFVLYVAYALFTMCIPTCFCRQGTVRDPL